MILEKRGENLVMPLATRVTLFTSGKQSFQYVVTSFTVVATIRKAMKSRKNGNNQKGHHEKQEKRKTIFPICRPLGLGSFTVVATIRKDGNIAD